MQQSKLIRLLKTFTSGELRAFKDFVASPYYNKNKELIRLYVYLKKLAPAGFPEKKIERTHVFHQLYPDIPYDEKQLNHLMSHLFKLAEQFIGLQKFEQDGIMPEIYQLNAHIDRQQHKAYQYTLKRTRESLAGQVYQRRATLLPGIPVGKPGRALFCQPEHIGRFDHHLQEAADRFDVFLLAKKLKYSCHMLDRQKLIPQPYEHHLTEELSAHVDARDFAQYPAISVYHTLLQMLTKGEDESHFVAFRQLIRSYQRNFPAPEMRDLYYFAINYCINQLRLGKQSYAEDLMDLYDEGIQSGLLLEDGSLSPWTYKNVVRLALNLQRFNWAENFVLEYNEKLPTAHRQDAYYFNLAILYYKKKDYAKALEHLNRVEFSDIHYNLDAKATLSMIYQETGETEALVSLLSAFRIFLKRNKTVSRSVKEPYANFIQILYQVNKYGAKRKAELLEKVSDTKLLNSRKWLREVVEGL